MVATETKEVATAVAAIVTANGGVACIIAGCIAEIMGAGMCSNRSSPAATAGSVIASIRVTKHSAMRFDDHAELAAALVVLFFDRWQAPADAAGEQHAQE